MATIFVTPANESTDLEIQYQPRSLHLYADSREVLIQIQTALRLLAQEHLERRELDWMESRLGYILNGKPLK